MDNHSGEEEVNVSRSSSFVVSRTYQPSVLLRLGLFLLFSFSVAWLIFVDDKKVIVEEEGHAEGYVFVKKSDIEIQSETQESLLAEQHPSMSPSSFVKEKPKRMDPSEMEVITAPGMSDHFIDDPTNFCRELYQRANGTDDGFEPWRQTNGRPIYWNSTDCGYDGSAVLGNHLTRWYMMRAVASAAGVTLEETCHSAVTDLLPQVNIQPADTVLDEQMSWRSICDKCATESDGACKYPHGEMDQPGLDIVAHLMRNEMRNISTIVRARLPNLDLDEVAIHIRIGDIARQNHDLYGLVPFNVYSKLIPRSAKTIGIICAPFDQNRDGWGAGDVDLNRAVVLAARDHIQAAFPKAKVSIHNNETETTDMVYTRLIGASLATICGPSTFCVIPTIAAMGESFILQSPLFGDSTPNWITRIEDKFQNVHYVKEYYIPSNKVYNLNVSDIVAMLQSNNASAQ